MPAELTIAHSFRRANELQRVIHQLYIHTLDDFYAIPKSYISNYCRSDILKEYGGTVEGLVHAAFPTHLWSHDKFAVRRRALFTPQSFLLRIVRHLFGTNVPIKDNVRDVLDPTTTTTTTTTPTSTTTTGTTPTSTTPTSTTRSKQSLEIDIFLPSLKIGFEYQDPHHYFHSVFGRETLEMYRARDEKKKQLAAEKGIVLINVPFWWDWNEASLISTVKLKRPDLLTHMMSTAPPFSDMPPQSIIDKYDYEIPNFGTPMFALHSPSNHTFNPTGWIMNEKYDGVRGVWSAETRKMYSRWGRELPLRPHLIDCLPPNWLDGELWFGRGKEHRYLAHAIVTGRAHVVQWIRMQYVVFDCPDPTVRNQPYPVRYAVLQSLLPEKRKHFVLLADYTVVDNKEAVETFFFAVRSNGGEGVILRDPQAGYIHGYSRCLFKHKGYLDAEAKVIQKLPGNKFICKVNKILFVHNASAYNPALALDEHEDTWNIEMAVDSEFFDGQVEDINIGDFISFRYSGNFPSDLSPINPKIYAIRHDITSWDQLLKGKRKQLDHKPIWTPKAPSPLRILAKPKDQNHDKLEDRSLGSHAQSEEVVTEMRPPGHVHVIRGGEGVDVRHAELYRRGHDEPWTLEQGRQALDALARSMNFDPLVPHNWYTVSQRKITEQAKGFVDRYDYFGMAICDAYPDIGLRAHLFPRIPREYFKQPDNLKAFFDDFAKSKGFDPLRVDNWYSVAVSEIESFKPGVTRTLYRALESFQAMVKTAYPDLKWVEEKFVRTSAWSTEASQRKFLEAFAAAHHFDPRVPSLWAKHRALLYKEKGYMALVAKYKSFPKTMAHLYPTIAWPLNLRK